MAREKREREKQKKKERDEKLKAEGKYLTPAQKEKLRRQQALLANSSILFHSSEARFSYFYIFTAFYAFFLDIILPTALRRESEEEAPAKRPVYGKRKPKKGLKQDEKGISSKA